MSPVLQSDFFALELVSGHLYLHLGLGREPLKFRASRHSNQLANGEWHKVKRELNRADWSLLVLTRAIEL